MSKPAQQNDPRTRSYTGKPVRARQHPAGAPMVGEPQAPRSKPNPGAICAKELQTKGPASRCPVRGARGSSSPLSKHKRLSATDISALASMKNVAKCDTWCELQNPVNHRVFERKLRPKPLGRGHVCLGVTHRVAPQPRVPQGRARRGERRMASRALGRGWPKTESPAADVTTSGGRKSPLITSCGSPSLGRPSDPDASSFDGAPTATPGQAGLPAEFKHINKRRKRNLQGFP